MARILIIEDEPILRKNMVDRLRADGHDLVDTGSGEAGVELATLLAEHFVRTHTRRFGIGPRRLSAGLVTAMQRYPWPGNVRELSHVIESGLLVCDTAELTERHLRLEAGATAPFEVSLPGGRRIEIDFDRGTPALEEIEIQIIRAAYEYSGQNLSKTARMLGLTREAVRYRLGKAADASAGPESASQRADEDRVSAP